jgi:DNA-directed RNA polymerase specialized sigma24 family protein
MTADQIVASLRAKSPGALAELLDSYGDQLFQYCWCMLRSRDIAQIALRDALVVAEANIARLAEPELLGSWLYALARVECLRHSVESSSAEDRWRVEEPTRPDELFLSELFLSDDPSATADLSAVADDPSAADDHRRVVAGRRAESGWCRFSAAGVAGGDEPGTRRVRGA